MVSMCPIANPLGGRKNQMEYSGFGRFVLIFCCSMAGAAFPFQPSCVTTKLHISTVFAAPYVQQTLSSCCKIFAIKLWPLHMQNVYYYYLSVCARRSRNIQKYFSWNIFVVNLCKHCSHHTAAATPGKCKMSVLVIHRCEIIAVI